MSTPHPVLSLLLCASIGSVGCGGSDSGGRRATEEAAPGRPHLRAALDAGRWIAASGRPGDGGRVWPVVPGGDDTVADSLYSGVPGVVLFFLDLHRVTGDDGWLREALAGADHVEATLPSPDDEVPAGLYTGLAGRCFTLLEVALEVPDPGREEAARRCYRQLVDRARPAGAGLEWSDVTDVIGGGAGIGLALLDAAERLREPGWVATAAAAGDRLLELARPAEGGMKWAMSPDYPRLMPNFSHGTAGVAYYLARLHRVTGEDRYLEAAIRGARYLQSVAVTEGEICMVFHHEPDGEDLFYLSWCHGPAGTARTFHELWRSTGDDEWRRWTGRAAAAVTGSGIPERRTPGFWSNVSRCCGNAGVIDFFLGLHRVGGDAGHLQFARRVADDLMERATRDESGTRWVQAEHRVRPDEVEAQTGWMQGAAGIGSALLRLDAETSGHADVDLTVLPDSPWWRGS